MVDDRLDPYDLEAEESVLSACLLDSEAINKVNGWLLPEHFYRDKNQWVYAAMLECNQRKEPINQIMVAHELGRKDLLEALGGSDYLSNLILVGPTAVYIKYYAEIVHRLAGYRSMIEAGNKISEIGYNASPTFGESINEAEELVDSMRRTYPLDSENVMYHRESCSWFDEKQNEIGRAHV